MVVDVQGIKPALAISRAHHTKLVTTSPQAKLPGALHSGSSVDISRLLLACCHVLAEGGFGEDIADLPVAGTAPEWMSEKAIAIGIYVVGSGIFLRPLGANFRGRARPNGGNYLTKEVESEFAATRAFENDPVAATQLMIERLNEMRRTLNCRKFSASPLLSRPQNKH